MNDKPSNWNSTDGNVDRIFELIDSFALLWKNKGYRKEVKHLVFTIAGSEQMHDNYGTLEEAMEKLIEITKVSENVDEVVCEMMKLAKIRI